MKSEIHRQLHTRPLQLRIRFGQHTPYCHHLVSLLDEKTLTQKERDMVLRQCRTLVSRSLRVHINAIVGHEHEHVFRVHSPKRQSDMIQHKKKEYMVFLPFVKKHFQMEDDPDYPVTDQRRGAMFVLTVQFVFGECLRLISHPFFHTLFSYEMKKKILTGVCLYVTLLDQLLIKPTVRDLNTFFEHLSEFYRHTIKRYMPQLVRREKQGQETQRRQKKKHDRSSDT